MRRIAALVLAGALAACASMGAPPGGPERTEPPVLERVTPDSGSINVRARSVMFEFDEVVSDRDVANLFLVSPREGAPRVIWRRDRIEVRPRRPFRPNTAYSVTMLPGLMDLRNNRLDAGRTVVFSTGPTFPAFMVAGRVFDWMNERVAPGALVEVIRRPDSLPYVGAADSTGQFAVGPLDEGTYTVRALLDGNRNRAIDPGEAWDSVSIVVRGSSPFLELLAAQRDTIAPRLLTVTTSDSVSISASFDRPLDPTAPLTPASFRVVKADSTPVRVVAVLTREQLDSLMRVARDSAARLDTTVRRDTVPPVRVLPPAVPPVAPPPKPSRPPPRRDFIVRVDPPLQRGASYRITALNVRGLMGQTRDSDRVLAVPVARRDTTPSRAPVLPPSRPPSRSSFRSSFRSSSGVTP